MISSSEDQSQLISPHPDATVIGMEWRCAEGEDGVGMDRGADSPSEAGTRTLAGLGDKSARGRASISSSSKDQSQLMISPHPDATVIGMEWSCAEGEDGVGTNRGQTHHRRQVPGLWLALGTRVLEVEPRSPPRLKGRVSK
jgi:hypothetical protein